MPTRPSIAPAAPAPRPERPGPGRHAPGPAPAPAGPRPDVAARLADVQRGRAARWKTTVFLALRMMFHDKPKFLGTTLGVVFAVVLGAQQVGMLMGLLAKNTMLVDNAGADIWIVPPNTTMVQPGPRLSTQVLYQAKSTPGVAVASPLAMVNSQITKPGGGSEGVTIIGYDLDTGLGGPWNVVAGSPADLRHPDTLFFEDSQRERYGGINLGSVREMQGKRVRAAGFTWGLLPFGPAYAFGDIDTVRHLNGMPQRRLNFVLVDVEEGHRVEDVRAELARRIGPGVAVYTKDGLHDRVVDTLLGMQLGVVFGATAVFALIIGFVIVSLTMFSSVLDNLRELATLKALGLSNWDLTRMVGVQAIAFAILGSVIGLGLVRYVAEWIRSPNLTVIVPQTLIAATPVVMAGLCVAASMLALRRVLRLDPASVFR